VATGSNSNATLDLLAPGVDICSAIPNNGSDCAKYGTSMAKWSLKNGAPDKEKT
jgi:hypothetical protein